MRALVPMFIEPGVYALDPLQATVMDVVAMKRQYGGQIAFWGNINSCSMNNLKPLSMPYLRVLGTASDRRTGRQ